MAIKNTNTSPLLKEGANITLTQSGQVITIESTGGGSGTPGGSDTQIQFNDGGSFGGDAGLTYNKTTNVLGVESVDFAQTPTAVDAERRLHWDNDEGSLVFTLKGGNVTIPVGQEVTSLVYNAEATTLNKGEVVYAFGASGQRISVKRAVNTADSTSAQTLGVVAESIAAGAEGFVMVQGMVRGLNTSSYVQGDTLYLGATSGTFTKTKPYAPNHLVYVGFVVKVNASSGEIFVKPQNGYEMAEIHDYQEGSVQNNDVVSYESSSGLYKPKGIVTLLGFTPAPASRMITINGTSQDLTADRTWSVGTVTSVGLSAPTGFSVANSPVISSGTLALSFASGYSLPTTASQTNWDTAYTNRITSLTTTGSSGAATLISNTLNIPNYTLAGLGGFANPMNTLGDVIYGGASGTATRLAGNTTTTRQFLRQTGTGTVSAAPAWDTVTKTDVGLANVENTALSTWAGSTNITTLGTIATGTWNATTISVGKGGTGLTALGSASQLLRVNTGGTALEYFTPTYLTAAITSLGGLTAATQTFANDTNVTITSATSTHTLGWTGQLAVGRGGTGASTLTGVLLGNGTSAFTAITGTASQYLRRNSGNTAYEFGAIAGGDVTGAALTKTDDTNVTLTLGGTPSTALLRAASLTLGWTGTLAATRGGTGLSALGTANQLLRVNSGATALEYFTPSYLTAAITSLNGLTGATQTFATGTTGTDFNISSATSTHTFNIPTASATNRGALSSADWTTFNNKFTLPSLTSGSVLFSNGTTIAQDNANLFWDDTNNRLGIGTASPNDKLHISVNGTTAYSAALWTNSSSTANLYVGVGGNSVANTPLRNNAYVMNSQASDLAFGTSDTVRMLITSGGNVGIGTPSPNYKLDVNGTLGVTGAATINSTSPLIFIGNGNSGTYTQTAIYCNQNNTSSDTANGIFIERGRITDSPSGEIRSFVIGSRGGQIQFLINKDGNLLINTTTDNGAKLQVNGSATFSNDVSVIKSSDASLIVNNTSVSGKSYRLVSKDDGKFYIQNTGIADLFNIASTGAATFSSSVTVNGLLTINNGSGVGASLISSSFSGIEYTRGSSLFGFIGTENSASGGMRYNSIYGNYEHKFYNNSVLALTIDSTRAATFTSSVEASSLKKTGGTSSQYLMADGSTSTLSNPATGTGTTNYVTKYTGTSTIGNSSITDNGTTVELTQGRLKFPATQISSTDANTLDDYEEGDWTPYYKLTITNFPSITYDAVTQARYVKIGKTVFFNGEIRTDSCSFGSGELLLGGFPIARADNRDLNLTITYARDWASEHPRAGSSIEGLGSTTEAALYRTRPSSTAGDVNLDTTDIGTGADDNWMIFYGFYRTLN